MLGHQAQGQSCLYAAWTCCTAFACAWKQSGAAQHLWYTRSPLCTSFHWLGVQGRTVGLSLWKEYFYLPANRNPKQQWLNLDRGMYLLSEKSGLGSGWHWFSSLGISESRSLGFFASSLTVAKLLLWLQPSWLCSRQEKGEIRGKEEVVMPTSGKQHSHRNLWKIYAYILLARTEPP